MKPIKTQHLLKRIGLFIILIINSIVICGQAPLSFKYQAILRNETGVVLNNQNVTIEIQILKGTAMESPVFTETHNVSTNDYGLVNLEIGTVESASFAAIDWGETAHFIRIFVDGTEMGTNQLLSVPYALYAQNCGNDNLITITDNQTIEGDKSFIGSVEVNTPTDANHAVNKAYADALSSKGWALGGNFGTDPENNFIGTLDESPLIFRVNDTTRMILNNYEGVYFPNKNYSVYIGTHRIFKNFGAFHNVFIGSRAGRKVYSGTRNVGVGAYALNNDSSGIRNTAIGDAVLRRNTEGSFNTAVGSSSLSYNINGETNTSIGFRTMELNRTGSNNVAIGGTALYTNRSGNANIALGARALYYNYNNSNLVAIGDSSLYNNSKNKTLSYHGAYNTAVGSKSLQSNTTGYSNTALGYQSLRYNTTGYYNTALGYQSLNRNTTGIWNNAIGNNALSRNKEGSYNIAIGNNALIRNEEGNHNIAIGVSSLLDNQDGDRNISIGYYAGPNSLGPDLNNTIAIGYNARTVVSNSVRIGNLSTAQIGGYVNWSNLSDGRFKTNIKDNVPGLDFILKLNPITYNWNTHKLTEFINSSVHQNGELKSTETINHEKEEKTYTGFIAQDVENAAEACNFNFSGIIKPANEKDHYNLSYAEFVVPLVKAIQEQQEEIEKLKKQIEELKNKKP